MNRRTLFALVLVASVAIQGGVAVLPHTHGPVAAGDLSLLADAAHESAHHCLACSVHAPVVEAAAASGFTSHATSCTTVWLSGLSTEIEPALPFSGPRGPPSAV